jgi:hypothetical protein
LFVSKRRLQKQRQEPRKFVRGSIPSEVGFCSSETKSDRRTAPRPKLFVSKRRLQEQTSQHRKLSWVRILTKKFYVAPKLSIKEERRKAKFGRFGEEVTGTKVTYPKTVLGSSLGEGFGFRDNFSIKFNDT